MTISNISDILTNIIYFELFDSKISNKNRLKINIDKKARGFYTDDN